MTMEDINRQYQILCSQVGDAQYKIRQHEELIKQLYSKIDELNKLAEHVKAAETAQASQALETSQVKESPNE